jgi:Fe-S-cluster containining protein
VKSRLAVHDVPECVECGTCCFSTLPEYVRVFGGDWERMDDVAHTYVSFDGNRAFMRLEDGHCAALVLEPAGRRYVCAIYPVRPDVCRSLERGSGGCRGELHEKRERPLLAMEALLAKVRGLTDTR